ncbi:hypothetical protein MNV49_001358 [Pseudohyphozyma bogoriensis]|nr:hypothetical protein MNV49_001358 [Pseudohyphozyma bogoriensis]
MTSILLLPPEVVLEILELAVESGDPPLSWVARRQQFCSTALVARSWTRPSQMLLWKEMDFIGADGAARIDKMVEATGTGLYRTVSLKLYHIPSQKSAKLLAHLKGVKKLIAAGLSPAPNLFCSDALKELKSLELHDLLSSQVPTCSIVDGSARVEKMMLDNTAASSFEMTLQEVPYLGASEKFLITLDIGNTNSSVSIVHLQFGKVPLVRTVNRYPGGHTSSRVPSTVAYDLKERPRAFGAEVYLPDVVAQGKNSGWTITTAFKSQMVPVVVESPKDLKKKKEAEAKALKKLRKDKPDRSPSTSMPALSAPSPIPRSPSMASLVSFNGIPVGHSRSSTPPEQLTDAITPPSPEPWVHVEPVNASKRMSVYQGPTLKLIYADHIKHLVACARAWFGETVEGGEEIFMRLWNDCIFVLAHPADWKSSETDILREAMQLAKLLPASFAPGRLVFVKEPAASVYFARRNTRDATTWLTPGTSFALCDAAEHGTSLIGYTTIAVNPLLKLKAYEPVSRLLVGSGSVTKAFHTFITKKLHKTKFKGAEHVASIMELFDQRIKPKFNGADDHFELKFAAEGYDNGARIKDGRIWLTGVEIQDVLKPTVDAIIVRLSSIIPRGNAKSILVAGGFGESPYLQRRLQENFEPSGISVIIPDIPTHNAVSEGAARFYLAETVQPKALKFALGTSTAVDWSENWVKGMEREMFNSVSGKRMVLGRWSEVVPKGTVFDLDTTATKTFNVKYVLAAGEPIVKFELYSSVGVAEKASSRGGSFDGLASTSAPETAPQEALKGSEWLTDLKGVPNPAYVQLTTLTADVSSSVPLLAVQGQRQGLDRSKWWVAIDFEVLVYVGSRSLEACIAWKENVSRYAPFAS